MSSPPLDLAVEAPPPARRRQRPARGLAALVRPRQWMKNLLVVPLPLVDPAAWATSSIRPLAAAVVTFILASSLVYVGNDIADRERDRSHPVKRHRPIASGAVSVPLAAGFGALLAATLAATLLTIAPRIAWVVGAYLVVNVLYSVWLKHVPLLDLFAVVIGFQLRVVAGYQAIGSAPSTWLLLCTFFLCLVLILGKRRKELAVSGVSHRASLAGYSPGFVDQMLTLSAGLAAVAFLFFLTRHSFPLAAENLAALLLTPLAVLGLFRYLQIITVEGSGGDPVRALLQDRVILCTAALCAVIGGVLVVTGGAFTPGWHL